ncbi:MAG: hypothetical protein EXS09_03120 [Gemmataceae bacterium]|nr:hypothetical protein [Gemmataceae bacterium]
MKHVFFALGLAMVCFSSGYAQQEENPYKKSKVGDYYTFKMTTKIAGIATEGELTQTVTTKDDKEAIIAISGKLLVMGMDVMIPAKSEAIDLTKPYDPTKATGKLPEGTKVEVVKLKDGPEALTLGKTKYTTKWQTYKLKMSTMGMDFEADLKVWQTKDANVPMVKMEMTSEVMGNKFEVIMELSETGNRPVEKVLEKK